MGPWRFETSTFVHCAPSSRGELRELVDGPDRQVPEKHFASFRLQLNAAPLQRRLAIGAALTNPGELHDRPSIDDVQTLLAGAIQIQCVPFAVRPLVIRALDDPPRVIANRP